MNETDSLSQLTSSSFSTWIESPRASFLLLLAIAVVFRLTSFGHLDLRGNDELSYTNHARIFEEQGFTGFRASIQHATDNPETLTGPPPFRLLYFCAAWASCKLLGGFEARNLAWLSFASGIGTVLVGFALFRKWFSSHTAFAGALLLVTSPLNVALSRRALQDSFVTFLIILSVLFFHQCWVRRRRMDAVWFGLCVWAGLLTKESMLFLYPCFAVLAIYYAREQGRGPLWRIAWPLVAALALYLIVMAWISGGVGVYLRTYRAYAGGLGHSDYVLKYQQGPWFRYLIDFMLLSPLVGVLGIFGAGADAEPDRTGRHICLLYLVSGIVVFSALLTMNVRLVLFLDPFLRGLAAAGAMFVVRKIPQGSRRVLVAIAVVGLLLAVDIRQFQLIFVQTNVFDPFTLNLLNGDGFLK